MKAVRINEFGGTEVLKIQEIEHPVPAADEILIKVYASGVNPADWVIREGGNDFLKPILKLPLILGWDVAGIVEDAGSNVTDFNKGDEVYGIPDFPGDGSYAEYVAAKASQLALKPESISFNEAAGVPLAGLVAWTALFELGKLQAGQHIFIHGASGGVGSFAVQFAKAKIMSEEKDNPAQNAPKTFSEIMEQLKAALDKITIQQMSVLQYAENRKLLH
jgi:NADPH:quinone reductase-like Zn-dependent oxidoreductase